MTCEEVIGEEVDKAAEMQMAGGLGRPNGRTLFYMTEHSSVINVTV